MLSVGVCCNFHGVKVYQNWRGGSKANFIWSTLTGKILIPRFNKYRYRPCSSIHSLGILRKVAGIGRRPMLPYQQETMKVVWDYVEQFRKTNGLHQPFSFPEMFPLVQQSNLVELNAKARFYRAEEIRRSNKKARARQS